MQRLRLIDSVFADLADFETDDSSEALRSKFAFAFVPHKLLLHKLGSAAVLMVHAFESETTNDFHDGLICVHVDLALIAVGAIAVIDGLV